MKTFHLLAGLPRSGSTLLASILQQNPMTHATPNSLLVGLLYETYKCFQKEEQAKAFRVDHQIENSLYFLANGFYAHVDKPVIIDKSRGWPASYDLAELSFRNTPKMLATVRSLPDILASFDTLAENNINNYIDQQLIRRHKNINTETRCEFLIESGGTLFESWSALKVGYDNFNDHIHFVEYDNLMIDPHNEMNKIYDFLDLPRYNHDFNNIINHTPEDDKVYGIDGMHSVRKVLKKSSNNSIDILGHDLYNRYIGGEFWRQ